MSANGGRGERKSARGRAKQPDWVAFSDEELLEMRVCDLGLRIEGTDLEGRIHQLEDELEHRGLRFRPHYWLSDEWFSPDGVPGVAIPFYLAHPRLMRLERNRMFEVEGGNRAWCLRILRHETGHALDNAYRLHHRKKWRETFGKFSEPYPDSYQPKPYSKSYVVHLDPWYAQAHPAEDFAETFAVWLKPRSQWRARYKGWPAIKKLEYVDALMSEIRDRRPVVNSRARVDAVRTLKKTLRAHYEEKRNRYRLDQPHSYDAALRKLFSEPVPGRRTVPAATFLGKQRVELRRTVARWSGQYRYTVDQVLREMIQRCRELDLRLDRPAGEAEREALVMLTVQMMNTLHSGEHRFSL